MQLGDNAVKTLMGSVTPASSQFQPVPIQESLNSILEQTLTQIEISLKHADQMISHVGSALSEDSGTPQVPGVMGKAFDLRTRVQRLNGKLEQLAALL